MKFELRQYQKYCVDNVQNRDIVVIPTGGGKSAIICSIAESYSSKGLRVLIVVPTRELKRQFEKILKEQDIFNVGVSVYKSAHRYQSDVYLSDEVHHSACKTWDNLISNNNEAIHIGFTATPFRLDGKPLDKFTRVIEPVTTKDLVSAGYLVPGLDEYSVDLGTNIQNSEDLESQFSVLNRNYIHGQIVDNFLKYCKPNTRSILFGTSIKHCEELEARFNAVGVKAATISYKDSFSAQKAKLDWFKNGFISMLLNVSLLVEGVDVPEAENVLLCRYGSMSFYFQAVGRVLRKKPNKAIVLDFVGNIISHGSVLANTGWSDRFYAELENKKLTVPYCTRCYALVSPDLFLKGGVCTACCGTVSLKKSSSLPVPKEQIADLKKFTVPLFEQALFQAKKVKDWQRFATALKKTLAFSEDNDRDINRLLEVVEERYTGRRFREIEKIIRS